MSSTEDDEPPAKKTRPEAKKAKMVAPPEEWTDFLELDKYPQPPGHVRAVLCHPWLTCPPPQDAEYAISFKDILRPCHTYKGDVLPMSGLYFLKLYTRILYEYSRKTGARR